jgi:hypothetical protein
MAMPGKKMNKKIKEDKKYIGRRRYLEFHMLGGLWGKHDNAFAVGSTTTI